MKRILIVILVAVLLAVPSAIAYAWEDDGSLMPQPPDPPTLSELL